MSFFSKIKSFFSAVLRNFRNMLKVIFSGATEVILAQLKDIALQAVTELENTDLTNDNKRKEAFKRIGDYAKGKKITVTSSLINLAIELALQYMKAKIGG